MAGRQDNSIGLSVGCAMGAVAILAIIAVLLVVTLLAVTGFGVVFAFAAAHSGFTIATCMVWGTIGIAVVVMFAGSWKARAPNERMTEIAQGVAGVVTVVALFIAAGIYFLQRADKPRLSVSLHADAVPLTMHRGQQDLVLLTVQIPIENRSAVDVDIQCITLDVLRPGPRTNWNRRNPLAAEEVLFPPENTVIRYALGANRNCLLQEEARFAPTRSVQREGHIRPLFMWAHLFLEPGDERNPYFEIPIHCDAPFVRVLVKVRIRPEDSDNHEVKTIVPLTDICRGTDGSSSSVANPISQLGQAVSN